MYVSHVIHIHVLFDIQYTANRLIILVYLFSPQRILNTIISGLSDPYILAPQALLHVENSAHASQNSSDIDEPYSRPFLHEGRTVICLPRSTMEQEQGARPGSWLLAQLSRLSLTNALFC